MIQNLFIAGAALGQAGHVTASMLTPIGQGAATATMVDGAGGVTITASQPTAFLLPTGYANVRLEARLRVTSLTGDFLFGLFSRGSLNGINLQGYMLPAIRFTAGTPAGQARYFAGATAGSSNTLGTAGVGTYTPPGTLADYATADIYMQAELFCADLANPASPTAYRARAFLATQEAMLGNVPAWQVADSTITRTAGAATIHWQTQTGCGLVIPIGNGSVQVQSIAAYPIEGLT